MPYTDTKNLLRECDAGTKIAINSIQQVLPHTTDSKLKEVLQCAAQRHADLGKRAHKMLDALNAPEKDPSPIARTMTQMTTAIKLTADSSNQEIASVMYDGCRMGIKSLSRYLNQYSAATPASRDLAGDLIASEEELTHSLLGYL